MTIKPRVDEFTGTVEGRKMNILGEKPGEIQEIGPNRQVSSVQQQMYLVGDPIPRAEEIYKMFSEEH